MPPTASQVHDLCVDLKFIGKIGEDEKIHVGSKTIQPATTLFTRIMRMLSWEDNTVTIKYVLERTGRGLEFADQLATELHDPDKRDMFLMIREDLEGCVAPDRGLGALHDTYLRKHAPASELEVIIRNIKMKLAKYRAILPSAPPPPPVVPYVPPPQVSPQLPPSPQVHNSVEKSPLSLD